MNKPVKGHVLITGASGGIGAEFARALASMGCDLVLASRSLDKLNALKKELEEGFKISAKVVPADLSKPGGAGALYSACRKQGLEVGALVNNAGSGLFGESLDQATADVDGMLVLNTVSLTDLCRLFGRDMRERRAGHILNIGSLVGFFAAPFFASYAASKSYVLNYSVALRAELKRFGVTVSCLLPGFVRTSFDRNSKIESDKYSAFAARIGMDPARVARIGVKLLFRNKSWQAAGLFNRLASAFAGMIPKRLVAWAFQGFIRGLMK